MEDFKLEGLIIIKDSVECSGEALWMSYVDKARRTFTQVRLLLTVTWADTLERRYRCVCNEGVSLEMVDGHDALLKITERDNGRTAVFVDSINMALMWCTNGDDLIRILKRLAGGLLVARVHEEGLSEAFWQRLCSVADSTLCLRTVDNITPVCRTVYYKKSGRRIQKDETFKVDNQSRLTCSTYAEEKPTVAASETAKADNPLEDMVLPFDIGLQLSEAELRAKRSVKLPYMAAQTQEGLVGISASGHKKVRAGGRIIYTPDEADDLDDSDPDDDLMI